MVAVVEPSPSGRAGIRSFLHITISCVSKSNWILCFHRNGVPRILSYLSRLAISRYVLIVIEADSMHDSVMKFTFDQLPEQPSCKVTGLSSCFTGRLATRVKSGLTASVVLPESNSMYALTPFIFTYVAR